MPSLGRQIVTAAFLATRACSIQPSAPEPLAAPLRELPWSNQINFLHTTDTHGWHAGHLQEPAYGADWGDYLSFTHHMKRRADAEGADLLLVDTGDKVEGNGLYDFSDPKGKFTYEIFRAQHMDIITCGNHELYKQNTSENEYKHIIPHYRDSYISSNIDIVDPKSGNRVPLAQRFRKFTTKNQGIRIMAFGFLFDFRGSSEHAFVQRVEDTIQENWFKEAIRDRQVDLFVVAGHSAARSTEFELIYNEIRREQWDAPIVFFGGHYHIRDYKKYDSKAYSIASGRYLETIGFQSISGLAIGEPKSDSRDNVTQNQQYRALASPTFARRYIDNNLFSFYHHTSTDAKSFSTPGGRKISAAIAAARESLQLDQRFGCAPKDYWTNRAPYPGSDESIFTWLEKDVVPEMVVDPERKDKPRIIMANTGTMRFDVFKGAFTRDTTFIIQPFTNGFRYLKDVPFEQADKLLSLLNHAGQILESISSGLNLDTRMLPPPQQVGLQLAKQQLSGIPFITSQQPHQAYQRPLARPEGRQQQSMAVPANDHNHEGGNEDTAPLTPGYTTIDDAGRDGDDTVHAPLKFYNVPNCFEARVGTRKEKEEGGGNVDAVDLIFLDFIQPWVLQGLKFLGEEYTKEDTEEYAGHMDFTTMISTWVGRHWNETDC